MELQSRIFAEALSIDVSKVEKKKKMLEGICKEAIEILKSRDFSPQVFGYLKKVVPLRQIEMAELMVSVNNYAISYAKALFAATPNEQLLKPQKSKSIKGISPEDFSKMEQEMSTVNKEFKNIEDSHGQDVLQLVIAKGYIKKIIGNAKIVRYLSKNHSEIFEHLQAISEVKTIDE